MVIYSSIHAYSVCGISPFSTSGSVREALRTMTIVTFRVASSESVGCLILGHACPVVAGSIAFLHTRPEYDKWHTRFYRRGWFPPPFPSPSQTSYARRSYSTASVACPLRLHEATSYTERQYTYC